MTDTSMTGNDNSCLFLENKWVILMCKWISLNQKIELFEIEQFDHSTVSKQMTVIKLNC